MAIKLKRIRKPEEIEQRRDDIIGLVQKGGMQPDEADRIAVDEDLGTFAEKPDPARFDVMNFVSWPLEMVMAWIIWRDPVKVTEFHTPFREDWIYWRPLDFSRPLAGRGRRWSLESKGPATLRGVSVAAALGAAASRGDVLMGFDEAKEALWRRLESDDVAAHGRNFETGHSEKIEAFHWAELRIDWDAPNKVGYAPTYINVRCNVGEITKWWPTLKELHKQAAAQRGRKQKYDWNSFQEEALRVLDEEGAFNPAVDCH